MDAFEARPARRALPLPAWAGYLLCGVVTVCGYAVLSHRPGVGSTVSAVILYLGLTLSTPVAILAASRRRQGAARTPWVLLATAQLAYFGADMTVLVQVATGSPWAPGRPGLADALYVVRYSLLLAALYLVGRRRAPARDLPTLLDAAIITVAAGLLGWQFALEPLLAPDLGGAGLLAAVNQPLIDLALLSLTVRLLLGRNGRSPAFGFLVAGASLNIATNSVLSLQLVTGAYAPRSGLEIGWLAASLLFAVAALHPSAARLTEPASVASPHVGRLRLGLLAAASMTAPAVLLVQDRRGVRFDVTAVAGACAVLFLLVLARLSAVLTAVRAAAVTDELTGLANRTLFVEQVRTSLAQARRHGTHTAVLFIDVDRFKLVNDALGHDAGDTLLTELAHRLRACLRDGDVAARHGGDEFTVLLAGLTHPDDAHTAADRIRAALSLPVTIGTHRIDVSVSIGVTTPTDDSDTPLDLLRYADAALYRAKDAGRGRTAAFDQTSRESLRRKISEEAELRDALETGQIVAWFQPLVDLRTGRIVGAEALARWIHPTDGVRLPARFFPLAAEIGLRSAISREVGLQVHHLLGLLGDDVAGTFRAAINLGIGELSLAEVVERSMAITEEVPAMRRRITLEVTETAVITDVAAAGPALARARVHGFAVALDDFGTGYSSLSLLRDLPLDAIKIDRSFVPRMATSPADAAIVEATVSLGHRLGLDVIAEGVETEEQAEHLLRIGVTHAQGFRYSPAVPPEQLLAWIRHGAPWQAAADAPARPGSLTG